MHAQFLQQAIDLAIKNVHTGNGGPFGAVICQDNKVISACAVGSLLQVTILEQAAMTLLS